MLQDLVQDAGNLAGSFGAGFQPIGDRVVDFLRQLGQIIQTGAVRNAAQIDKILRNAAVRKVARIIQADDRALAFTTLGKPRLSP